MNEKKARGLLAAAMSTAMFVSSTAGAVPVLANDAAGPQAQSDSTPELVPQPQSVAYAGGTLEVSGSVNVEGGDQADADAVADLKDFLSENGIQVKIFSSLQDSSGKIVGKDFTGFRKNPAVATMKDAVNQLNSLGVQLGLTPKSRQELMQIASHKKEKSMAQQLKEAGIV